VSKILCNIVTVVGCVSGLAICGLHLDPVRLDDGIKATMIGSTNGTNSGGRNEESCLTPCTGFVKKIDRHQGGARLVIQGKGGCAGPASCPKEDIFAGKPCPVLVDPIDPVKEF
jgi:hypothetical protein